MSSRCGASGPTARRSRSTRTSCRAARLPRGSGGRHRGARRRRAPRGRRATRVRLILAMDLPPLVRIARDHPDDAYRRALGAFTRELWDARRCVRRARRAAAPLSPPPASGSRTARSVDALGRQRAPALRPVERSRIVAAPASTARRADRRRSRRREPRPDRRRLAGRLVGAALGVVGAAGSRLLGLEDPRRGELLRGELGVEAARAMSDGVRARLDDPAGLDDVDDVGAR